MINYAKKYNLNNNLAFVLGVVGLIGKEFLTVYHWKFIKDVAGNHQIKI